MNHLLQNDILNYLDNTLVADAHLRIETHCVECATCRAELALHRAIGSAVRTDGHLEPSFGFTARVMDEIYPEPAASNGRWLLRNVPAWMMAVSVAVVLVFVAVMPGTPHSVAASPSAVHHGIAMTSVQAAQSASGVFMSLSAALVTCFRSSYGMVIAALGFALMVYAVSVNARRGVMMGR